jgi:TPR repeat protein
MRSLHTRQLFVALAFLGGCGGSTESTSSVASAAPSTSAAPTDAGPAEVRPVLTRKMTPSEKRKSDETACNAGNAEACRSMADRFRGYGHPSGCGIERQGHQRAIQVKNGPTLKVRIKRMSEDWEADEDGFDSWNGKACDLGNAEACVLDRGMVKNFRSVKERPAADMALRSSVETSAILLWKKAMDAKEYAKILEKRTVCPIASYSCGTESLNLYRRDMKKDPTALDASVREQAEAIIKKTLDARTVLMMLDKNGYTAEMVAPVRAHATKVLVDACIEGSCVCGDAAQLLAADDARLLDLARFGCENGEAEGCYQLGRIYEDGRGVPKDERTARLLYELACPPRRPFDYADEPKTSDYSVAACDRLAEVHEGGAMPPKDLRAARYYAEFACRYPGMQYDHAPCIRLGRYWTSGAITSSCIEEGCPGNLVNASEKFNGPSSAPFEGKECERPSVKALCDKYKGELEAMKKPQKPRKP